MKKTIKEIGLSEILPLFACKDISDSMRENILEHTYYYSEYEYEKGRYTTKYIFSAQNGHELAEICSGYTLSSCDLTNYNIPRNTISSPSMIREKIKEIDDDRNLELQRVLSILKNILKDEFYQRTKELAFYVVNWNNSKKSVIYSQYGKKIIAIQLNENTSEYSIVFLEEELYNDLF